MSFSLVRQSLSRTRPLITARASTASIIQRLYSTSSVHFHLASCSTAHSHSCGHHHHHQPHSHTPSSNLHASQTPIHSSHMCNSHTTASAFSTTSFSTDTESSSSSSSPSSSSPSSSPISDQVVRVRYAPSPTGSLHLGGLRTALYNYLLAKQTPKGKFLIRIEDTDQKRLVQGAVDSLLRTLQWAGIEADEGPNKGGDVGPYVQSERLELYQKYAQQLVEKGHAYPCFCSSERLDELRDLQQKKGLQTTYDRLCYYLPEEEKKAKLKEHQEKKLPYVIRMKVPSGTTIVKDLIRGTVTFPNKTVDDQVLLKSDGFPTYHLANIVDDHLMGITHVIRGEEWLTSTPKHVMLYTMFGWEVPKFAHLPLLLKPNGMKLSKRHEDAAAEYYMNQGFLPEAVVNFVAFLGWNPGTTKEIFSMQELIQEFNISRVQKGGAVVNMDKMRWFNAQHMRHVVETDMNRLINLTWNDLQTAYPKSPLVQDKSYIAAVYNSLKEHVVVLSDFITQSRVFFLDPDYSVQEAQDFKKKNAELTPDLDMRAKLLQSVVAEFSKDPRDTFSSEEKINAALKVVWKTHKVKQKQLFLLVRYGTTGTEVGPSLTSLLMTLGHERVKSRLLACSIACL